MHRFVIVMVWALISWGCTTTPEAPVVDEKAPPPQAPLSGEWVLLSMNGTPLAELTVSLEFQGTQIAGMSFCNTYSSNITVDGDTVTINPAIAATKMFCPEGDTMTREQAYFDALSAVASYAVVGEQLELRDVTGQAILVYQR
ncbi:MAG: META domain-containing protein [Chloroflexi bacterium]|nr:META domain-containing protein [Chloroflexota bacterium]